MNRRSFFKSIAAGTIGGWLGLKAEKPKEETVPDFKSPMSQLYKTEWESDGIPVYKFELPKSVEYALYPQDVAELSGYHHIRCEFHAGELSPFLVEKIHYKDFYKKS